MSYEDLIKTETKDYVIMDKKTVPDGYGGVTTEWKEGAPIKAALFFNDSTESRIGFVNGAKSVYTIYTDKKVLLQPRDVIKRVSDGKFFRITSDGEESRTPETAMINIRTVSAEAWTP